VTGRRRIVAALAVSACITALGAVSASAAKAPAMRVVGVPAPMLRALSPFTRLTPYAFYPGQRAVTLQATGGTVTINDVDYRLRLSITQIPASFGMDEQSYMDVNLYRRQPAAIGQAQQQYDYGYNPTAAFAFSYDHTALSTASIDTGTIISPDAVTAGFAATGTLNQQTCRISRSGRRGVVRSITGDLSYSQFSIDTTTTPFFGVLTQGPLHGRLIVDPGCGFDDSRFTSRRRICAVREELDTQSGSDGLFAEVGYQGHRAFEAAITSPPPSSNDYDRFSFGLIASAVAPTDLPRPRHTMHGATAHLHTTGDPFMSGSATFHSGRAPHITKVHRCFAFGRWHRYQRLSYSGRIRQDVNPLTALFDTGAVSAPTFARLNIWRYLS
jgi:hypothetical protein